MAGMTYTDADRAADRARKAAYLRDLRARRRERVLDHYGRACACCGSTDDPTIDHANGDGQQHMAESFGSTTASSSFYAWLIASGFPEGFQTLCRPCNSSKKRFRDCLLHRKAPRPRL